MRQSLCSHECWLLWDFRANTTSTLSAVFNTGHRSTRAYLKHILSIRGSLPVISPMYHCCPDLIFLCSTLATLAYFSLLKTCYFFIIKDQAAPPLKEAAWFGGQHTGPVLRRQDFIKSFGVSRPRCFDLEIRANYI